MSASPAFELLVSPRQWPPDFAESFWTGVGNVKRIGGEEPTRRGGKLYCNGWASWPPLCIGLGG